MMRFARQALVMGLIWSTVTVLPAHADGVEEHALPYHLATVTDITALSAGGDRAGCARVRGVGPGHLHATCQSCVVTWRGMKVLKK